MVVILFFHKGGHNPFNTRNQMFDEVFSVHAFFMISGFFMLKVISNPDASFKSFASKLWFRLVPVVAACVIVNWFMGGKGNLVAALALIDPSGLGIVRSSAQLTGGSWYASSYFYCALLLFWLVRRFKVENILPFLGVAVWFVCFHDYFWPTWGYSTLRAFAWLGLGIIVAYASRFLSFSKEKGWRIFFTVAELGCLFFLIRTVMFMRGGVVASMTAAPLLAFFIVASNRNAGLVSEYMNRAGWIAHASKYCYAMYLAQGVLMPKFVDSIHAPGLAKGIVYSMVVGILLYHLVEAPAVRWFSRLKKQGC
jgi:peptidoglycan/LPS O-acetylase OafA/YrhL